MNLIKIKIAVAVFSSYFVIPSAFCQQSSVAAAPITNGHAQLNNIAEEQEPIYRGTEYRRYRHYIAEGIPYFISDTLSTASIEYYGRTYTAVPLMLDETTEEIITRDITGFALIRLFSPRVNRFRLHHTDFIRIHDSTSRIERGFWQVLHNGGAQVLKKEIKKISDKVSEGDIRRFVEARAIYALQKDGRYFPVRSRETMLDAFGESGPQIRQHLKANRRKLKKASFEMIFVEAAKYFDTLAAKP